MRCVILQPSYIPWRGYFHQIQKSDVFVFYDDVQYDKHGWRNRNRIKTRTGSQWLTIPVLHKGNVTKRQLIKDIRFDPSQDWRHRHWKSLEHAYAKAPHFAEYQDQVKRLYDPESDLLADFTVNTTIELARLLGLSPRFLRSSELGIEGSRTQRLANIVKAVGAAHYISGPSARDYVEEAIFREAGIVLEYMSYDYPPYTQLHAPFDGQVSILDLIFMTGARAGTYIWGTPCPDDP